MQGFGQLGAGSNGTSGTSGNGAGVGAAGGLSGQYPLRFNRDRSYLLRLFAHRGGGATRRGLEERYTGPGLREDREMLARSCPGDSHIESNPD
jgi:hypothetical protein